MASSTAATIVANSANPSVIMVSICGPISAWPSWKVASRGRALARRGHGVTKMPAASSANAVMLIASEPRLLWNIDIGISPAGFIM